jgi:hypothetical protein
MLGVDSFAGAVPMASLTFSDWLGLSSIVIAVVGFGVALYQIRLAKQEIRRGVSAAEAARDAVQRTERLVVLIELLAAIPQMQRLERDLNDAVRDQRQDAVERHLQDWRVLAAETRGMLTEQTYATQGLESRLQESATAAAQAVDLLGEQDVASATKRAITVIAGACEEAGVLMGQLKAHPGAQQQ